MKELKLHLGGHPFKNNNLDLIKAAYTEAFHSLIFGLLKRYQLTGVRLSGCEITVNGNNIEITEGWICLKSVQTGQWEIHQVAQQNHTKLTNDKFTWMVSEVPEPPDPQTYADGGDKTVHIARVGEITSTSGIVFYPYDLPYLNDLLAGEWEIAGYNASNFTTDQGGGTTWNVTSGDQNVKYRIDVSGKTVEVKIVIAATTLSNGNAAALRITLPSSLKAKINAVGNALTGDNDPVYCRILAGQNTVIVRKYDGGNYSANLSVVEASIIYELQ